MGILNKHTLLLCAVLTSFAAPAYADGDVDKGKKVFKKCKACHVVDSMKKKAGPSLMNVIGREPASVEGYKYSAAMQKFAEGNVWDAETLSKYLTKPSKFVKGTKMKFGGLRKEADRDNVIAYLASFSE